MTTREIRTKARTRANTVLRNKHRDEYDGLVDKYTKQYKRNGR